MNSAISFRKVWLTESAIALTEAERLVVLMMSTRTVHDTTLVAFLDQIVEVRREIRRQQSLRSAGGQSNCQSFSTEDTVWPLLVR